ncbi:hypothetical protein OROMI_000647 [Orobanche minor]
MDRQSMVLLALICLLLASAGRQPSVSPASALAALISNPPAPSPHSTAASPPVPSPVSAPPAEGPVPTPPAEGPVPTPPAPPAPVSSPTDPAPVSSPPTSGPVLYPSSPAPVAATPSPAQSSLPAPASAPPTKSPAEAPAIHEPLGPPALPDEAPGPTADSISPGPASEVRDDTVDVTGTIEVMICRMWDVNTITGRYLSTDFVVSDAKGNVIHCIVRGNIAHNFLRLKEGGIYSIKNFVVLPNKEEYRIIKNDAFLLEFDGGTTIRKSLVKPEGFLRHPFQLVDFDTIEPTNNKYLIDVSGYVTNVGRIVHQKTGSRTVDFYLTNHSGAGLNKVILPVYPSEPKDGTLENLLIWARNRKNDTATFNCKVRIDNVRTKKGWNYPSCDGDKCKKGITRKERKFWCDACDKPIDYPVLRYRLELGVSDDTAHTVVVMFDETATNLVKCSADSILEVEDESSDNHSSLPPAIANIIGTTHVLELKSHTYYEYGSYESFTCWKINLAHEVEESACSSIVGAAPAIQAPSLKILSKNASVSTPSKPTEGKKKKVVVEDSDTEAASVSAEEASEGKASCPSDIKKKNDIFWTTLDQTRRPNSGVYKHPT